MAIKVLTTRKFREGASEEAYELLALLREAGTVRPGYISGHTLTSVQDPHTLLVISSWTDTRSWEAWLSSEKRKEISTKIAGLLEADEHVAVFRVDRKEFEADMA
jgi:heme-degrading monooxygenase HmoA